MAKKTPRNTNAKTSTKRQPHVGDVHGAASVVAPGREGSINVVINETIIDRLGGTTVTESIWRDEPNHNVIIRRITQPGVSSICASFFLTRRIQGTIERLVKVHTLKAGDVVFSQAALFAQLSNDIQDTDSSVIIMEIVNSFLRRAGMVVDSGDMSSEAYYPLKSVTVDDLRDDVAMQEVIRVLGGISTKNLPKDKFTTETFAAAVAEALVPVGRSLLGINELSDVIMDIRRAVLANLTNGLTSQFTGNMPSWFRDHPVVQELSHNYVFVKEALALPFGSSISPVSEGFKLDQWASLVLAALKSSRRYAIVKKQEVLRSLTKRTVRTLRGLPHCYVMHRSARPAPVAQCVYSFADSNLNTAYTIVPLKERIDQAISAAYNGGTNLGTDFAVDRFYSLIKHAVEGDFQVDSLGYSFDVGQYGYATVHETVALIAKEVIIPIDHTRIEISLADDNLANDNTWWFVINHNESNIPDTVPGYINGDEFITASLDAALLVTPDFSATAAMEAGPQLISPLAFNTRILDFDPELTLRSVDERFSYDVSFANQRLTGTIRAQDLGSLRAASGASLVRPRFNNEVFDSVAEVFTAMSTELDKFQAQVVGDSGGAPEVAAYLRRHISVAMLHYSQQLSPAFRAEVHGSISRRAALDLTRSEAIALTAQLSQRQFGAYADVAALVLFLNMQGGPVEWARPIIEDESAIAVFIEHGSDRAAMSI